MAMRCGYCDGMAVVDESEGACRRWVHADSGDRVTVGPGDYVSARHNLPGTVVLTCDLYDDSEDSDDE